MGGWLLPQQISDTTKERTSYVFPSFLSPSVTPFLCQCYMNAYLSLRCISIYTKALKMYIIKLRIETDKKIRIYVKLLQIFFYILWLKKIECGGKKYMRWGLRTNSFFFFGLTKFDRLWTHAECLMVSFDDTSLYTNMQFTEFLTAVETTTLTRHLMQSRRLQQQSYSLMSCPSS